MKGKTAFHCSKCTSEHQNNEYGNAKVPNDMSTGCIEHLSKDGFQILKTLKQSQLLFSKQVRGQSAVDKVSETRELHLNADYSTENLHLSFPVSEIREQPVNNDCSSEIIQLSSSTCPLEPEDDRCDTTSTGMINVNCNETVNGEAGVKRKSVNFRIVCGTLPHRLTIGRDWNHCLAKLLKHSLDLKSRNNSFENNSQKMEMEAKDDIHILRQNTFLPLSQLPVPQLELTVAFVHSEAQKILDRIAGGETVGAQESMKFEILRLCTYRNYPSDNKPFRIQLTSAGLYYASKGDEVVCYTCGLRRAGWNEKDKPLEIHKQIRPSCAFLVRNDSVNVPIPELPAESLLKFRALEEIISAVDTVPVVQSQRSQDSMARHGNFDLNTSESPLYRFFTPPPKHPQYAVQSVRLESFKGWPTNIPQTPQIMAECGYYYAGMQ